MKILGRLVVRTECVGLYFPFGESKALPEGVHEIREILGEMQIVYLGKPAMNLKRFNSLSLDQLYLERANSCQTQSEAEIQQSIDEGDL